MLSYYLLQGLLGHLVCRRLVRKKSHISSEIVHNSTIQNRADMMCVVLCYGGYISKYSLLHSMSYSLKVCGDVDEFHRSVCADTTTE